MPQSDFEQGLFDMMRFIACNPRHVEQASPERRIALIQSFAIALDAKPPFTELAVAQARVAELESALALAQEERDVLRALVAEFEAQPQPAASPETKARKPGHTKYLYETLAIGESVLGGGKDSCEIVTHRQLTGAR
jgi:hypothetical protein